MFSEWNKVYRRIPLDATQSRKAFSLSKWHLPAGTQVVDIVADNQNSSR
jgi:hypothetical protein